MKQAMCRADVNPLNHQKMTPIIGSIFGEEHMDDARFLQKDCVYRVKCVHCGECYTGETQQKLYKRIYGHWYPLHSDKTSSGKEGQESALTEHHLNHHKGMPFLLELVEVVKTCGYIKRKTMEAVVQATTDSTINRRIEGAGTVGNLYL